MGFCLLYRRAMARRGLIAALLRPSQAQGCPPPPFHLLSRSYSNKLFVGGLSFRTDEDAVKRAFAQHGEVVEVKLISDRETGRPKGFGFVTFESEADAETARNKMTGQLLDGRVIRVDKATSSRPPLPSSGFGGGSGSGGGGFSGSPSSSSLPPVAEDWGTIPSNVVDIGAGGSVSTATTPTASNFGLGTDSAKPFDGNSFGQAAASWPGSTPAPPSNPSAQTSSFSSSTFGSATSFNSSTFGASSSFNNSTFGSAATAPSSGSGMGWPGSTSSPLSSVSGVSAQGSSVNTTTFGAAATAPTSTGPVGGGTPTHASASASTAEPLNSSTFGSASVNASTFGSPTLDAKSFDGSTFGSASGNASTFGSTSNTASVNANTASFNASSTTVSHSSSTSASTNVPAATIIESTTATATSTIASSVTSGSAEVGASSTTSTTSPPGPPSAHPLSSPALTSSGSFDFSNFSFNSSSYRDNDPPLPRRRPRPRPRPASQSMSSDLNFNSSTTSLLETRSPFGSNNQFAETSIPKPKGNEMDFGLLNITAPCPPGSRPQGAFDIYIPDDLPEIPPPEPKPKPKPMSLSMFPHRQLPALDLPYHTPEADNWSEIGEDPPKYDLSTLFPSMGELIKKDKEFHWDPFDFDPEATLPPEEEVIVIDSDYD